MAVAGVLADVVCCIRWSLCWGAAPRWAKGLSDVTPLSQELLLLPLAVVGVKESCFLEPTDEADQLYPKSLL